MASILCAREHSRGSVVIMPSTSVQISIRRASSAAPMMAAEKSDPPRPSVVVTPAAFAAMKPPITTNLICTH